MDRFGEDVEYFLMSLTLYADQARMSSYDVPRKSMVGL